VEGVPIHLSAHLSPHFINETTWQISMKLGIWGSAWRVVRKFNFGLYESNITPTLCDAHIEIIDFLKTDSSYKKLSHNIYGSLLPTTSFETFLCSEYLGKYKTA